MNKVRLLNGKMKKEREIKVGDLFRISDCFFILVKVQHKFHLVGLKDGEPLGVWVSLESFNEYLNRYDYVRFKDGESIQLTVSDS
jgi:hypothetical protein